MRPIHKSIRAVRTDELQPGVVNENGGLQRVAGGITQKLLLRQSPQFGVNDVEQPIGGSAIAATSGIKQLGNFTHRAGDQIVSHRPRHSKPRPWGSRF